jgi:predicted DNA-binding transcriptional regulator YafY
MAQPKQLRLNKIIKCLSAHPDGMWLRQLGAETKIPPATIHRYLERELKDVIENIGVKDGKGNYFGLRIIRLKPSVQSIVEREGPDKVYKFLKLSKQL